MGPIHRIRRPVPEHVRVRRYNRVSGTHRLKAAAPPLATAMDHLACQSPCWCDPAAADRRHPGAVRHVPGDRPAQRAGRMGALRVLRRAFALVLGLKLYLITTPDGMPVAWCLASPKIGEREAAAELLAHAARGGALRPGLTLIGDKGLAGREFEDLVTAGYRCAWSAGPPRRGAPSRVDRLDPAVDRVGQRHPQGPARPRTPAAAPRKAFMPASPSGCWPWPPASGTTGPAAEPVKRSLTAYDN